MDLLSHSAAGLARRGETIAFRLTSSERAFIDELARADGISTSEYARRALFDGVRASVTALGEAAERGRDEVRPTVDKLQRELARSREAITEYEGFTQILQRDLAITRAPRDLVTAITQLLASAPRGRELVARSWGPLGSVRRRQLLPLAAAAVADHMEQSFAALIISARSIDEHSTLVERIAWLAETLTLDTAPPTGNRQSRQRARIGPLWAAYDDALHELGTRIAVFQERARLRSQSLAAAGWAEV